MSKIITLLILAATALHGYFYMQYKTVDACEVSAIRLKEAALGGLQLPADLGLNGVESDVTKAMANRIRAQSGWAECYRGAVFAPDAKAVGGPLL